jgi:phosphatidylserine/phosphatidylglycerophosphate/cardiolipin synthase-like enzyme
MFPESRPLQRLLDRERTRTLRRILGFTLLVSSPSLWASNLVLKNVPVQVFFSPNGGAQAAVVSAITKAKKTILVQAYSFTSAPIAGALKTAHMRGVEVRVILDRSQRTERYSGMTFLVHAGIPTWIDAAHAIAHNKVMVIDGRLVITGSFNFTKAAESKNAENLLIHDSVALAVTYRKNWEAHLLHAEAAM